MTIMETEIRAQSQSLRDCYRHNIELIKQIAQKVKALGIKHIIVSARGSSDHACGYFKYLCEIFAGFPVTMAAPSVVTVYNGRLDMSGTLVIGVSQSGEAEDVRAVLKRANDQHALTVSITNRPDSPMAREADYHLFLNVGEEKSVAATKTFTAQMYILAFIVAQLADSAELTEALLRVPDLIDDVINRQALIDESSDRLVRADDCYILGRGISYAAAQEAALKLQETTYIKARAFATSDFYHGPFAVLDANTFVLMIAPDDKTAKDSGDMLKRIKDTGADVTVFTDNKEIKADSVVLLPSCDEFTTPFIYTVCAQLFACNLSVKRGLSPDTPRGLNKVTITK